MAQLNIKSAKAYEIADRLARQHHRSKTAIVEEALEEKAARDADPDTDLVERIMAISKRTAPLLRGLGPAERATDFLYDDETGLPT